jgi:hypothetical protein
MNETSDGSLTVSIPAAVHDGILRLSVVDKRGRTVSTRLLLWHMRPTFAQVVVTRLLQVAVAVAISIVVLGLGLGLWLAHKPPLPGSLVIRGAAAAPLRLEVLGRKFKLATVTDVAGTSRWLILPASRSSLRVVNLGLHLRSAIVRRGAETSFDGRVTRLV